MPDFTPGPWEAEWAYQIHRKGSPACKSACANGVVSIDGHDHATARWPEDILSEKKHVVCFGHDYEQYGSIADEADARLIAAAPELYEALASLVESSPSIVGLLGRDGDLLEAKKRTDAAIAALAKARGEA